MHAIFAEKPWLKSHDVVAGMPAGMLGPIEGSLLFFLTRDYFNGRGEIIDAGSFLGASSYCLAKGLEENSAIRSKSGRLHAYDLFEVWREQETTFAFMASELKRIFGIEVADGESTLPIYMANVGPLGRHIKVNRGNIFDMRWTGRPIEILFLDICKSKELWRHVLGMFFPSLIPGVSVVVHQDYHHPLLPFIHVVQERLAPYFEIVDVKADDSATFLLAERIPDRVLEEVRSYDFDFIAELRLMDRAIERLGADGRHLEIAKAQLLRQNGKLAEARALIERLKQQAKQMKEDPKFEAYIGFVESNLFRDESKVLAPPRGFDEEGYLKANPDVKEAVTLGTFLSGFNHWLQFGKKEGRRWN